MHRVWPYTLRVFHVVHMERADYDEAQVARLFDFCYRSSHDRCHRI